MYGSDCSPVTIFVAFYILESVESAIKLSTSGKKGESVLCVAAQVFSSYMNVFI